MKHITEEHIERFVRFPETLTSSEKEVIRRELSANPELKAMAEWFTEFYDELDSLVTNRPSDGIIRLIPIEHNKPPKRHSFRILAAMTPASDGKSLETIATLASEDNGTVARVLRHKSKRAFKLHLIRRERPVKKERVIFTIEPLNIDLVIDESRHLTFDSSPKLENFDWNRSGFCLREPQLNCMIEVADFNDEKFSKLIEKNGRQVSIEYDKNKKSLIIYQHPGGFDYPMSRLLVTVDELGETLYRIADERELNVPVRARTRMQLQFFT